MFSSEAGDRVESLPPHQEETFGGDSSTRPLGLRSLMPEITVQIVRFVDSSFPGFVEARFIDASGTEHSFLEKVPVVSRENLLADSRYPRVGAIRCEIENEWQDTDGRSLAAVSTDLPDGVESAGGQARFIVLSSQINR